MLAERLAGYVPLIVVKVGLESEESKGGGCYERSELNAWLANGSSERTVGARPVVGAG
jgi:hypothetical protein